MQALPFASPAQNQQAQTANPLSSGARGAQASSENDGLNGVDFQNFLTLLTSQLRNQDPLNPAESTEFVAQLAQFTSVEQLVNANNKLDNIASSLVAGGIDKYAGWIGRQAEAVNAPANVDGAPVNYRLSGSGEAAIVETIISNRQGEEVTRFRAVNTSGVQTWDGTANGAPVPPGAYAINAVYYDADGNVIEQEAANTFGGVREVRLNGNEAAIVLEGGIEITPSQVSGLGLIESDPTDSQAGT